MDIKELLSPSDIEEKITNLKSGRGVDLPDVAEIQKKMDPLQHDVMDIQKRPDKPVEDENGNEITVPVCRIPLGFQPIIIERAVAFLFGNEVKLSSSLETPQAELIIKAIGRINKDAKIDAFNREVARALFTYTEAAEYWYPAKVEENNRYGFKTGLKLKGKVFSPENGDELYPYFDEYGDMIAFSRAFKVKSGDEDIDYFETWTADIYVRWKKDQNGWVEETPQTEVKLGRIPIVYYRQKHPEYYMVQKAIERIEDIMSNLGDTNDYFASPILFANGEVETMPKRGEQGKFIQGKDTDTQKSDLKYVSWDNAPESTKMEVEFLLRFIYSLSQTPDISFESVKGIGSAASGTSLKLLFMDPHLKMLNKLETFDPGLTRRYNILKAYIAAIDTGLKQTSIDMDIDNTFTPFIIGNDTEIFENIASGLNNGFMSRQTATELNPYVEDGTKELDRIKAEGNTPEALDKQQNEN